MSIKSSRNIRRLAVDLTRYYCLEILSPEKRKRESEFHMFDQLLMPIGRWQALHLNLTMKTTLFPYWAPFLASFLLFGCGKTTQEIYPIALKLELPATLAKGEKRREKFMSQADVLTVSVKTLGGEVLEQTYAKAHWEKILLPGFEFPRSPSDKMEVRVEVKARKSDGTDNTEAVLKGEGNFGAQDVSKDGQNLLSLKLSLTVQPENWD